MTEAGSNPPGEVTLLLRKIGGGDREALDQVFGLVYAELRRIAGRQLRQERQGHTLYPTALVHEAYLKLAGQGDSEWKSRAHFYGIASRAMRQILIDYARGRRTDKRGGGVAHTTLSAEKLGFEVRLDELLALNDALDHLDKIDERLRKVVEYRFFGGLSEKEIAELLGVTQRTVERDWVRARAWLYNELYPDAAPPR